MSGEFLDTIHLQAQAVWDVRRLLGWTRTRGEAAVGVYGLSLGGSTAALLAGLDADLGCVIAGMPIVDLVRLARWHVPAPVLRLAGRLGVAWDAVERLLRVTSPLALQPRVASARRFLFGGTADRLVPPEQVHALWQHWGRPRLVWHAGSHVSFGLEATVRALVHEALVATGMITRDAR
jgi:dienelactone hydrolase